MTAPGGFCLIRDTLRVSLLRPLLDLVGRAMGMNSAQRRLWLQAVRSSYTLGEAKAVIGKSALKGARVGLVPAFLMLGIAWHKP